MPVVVLNAGIIRSPISFAISSSSLLYQAIAKPSFFKTSAATWPPSRPLINNTGHKISNAFTFKMINSL